MQDSRSLEGMVVHMKTKTKALLVLAAVAVLFVLSLVFGYWLGAVVSGAAMLLTVIYALSTESGPVHKLFETNVLGDRGRDGKHKRSG
jgi:hypothetical protein